MIWPFKKLSSRVRALAHGSTEKTADPAYVSRPNIDGALAGALTQGENLVLYGPSHQGKTALLTRLLPSDAIFVECRPGFKRAQIYRVVLSSLGYAVLVEKKRSGKTSATVKLGVGVFAGEANAEGGTEQTMQPVTIDLKNSSEVAALISRIKNLPWIVLNNFQLLNSQTKLSLLFDLATFADRPGVRMMVVGSWPNQDYLEDLEPALAGRLRYVEVPAWSDIELRQAAAQWAANSGEPGVGTSDLEEFLDFAAGDISLFRSLVEGSIAKSDSKGQTAASSASAVQQMVVDRFRRGLATKLQAIYAERDAWVGYLALQPTTRLDLNPKFKATPNQPESDYLRTSINPQTGQPFVNGGEVRLDAEGNPQYIELPGSKVVSMRVDIVRHLLQEFHAVAQKGLHKVDLGALAEDFASYPTPNPIKLDSSKLKAALARFAEVQRRALVVPALLRIDSASQTMEIADRRLFLFLRSTAIEDLIEMLDGAQPQLIPTPRRHNQISQDLTESEKAAYVMRADS